METETVRPRVEVIAHLLLLFLCFGSFLLSFSGSQYAADCYNHLGAMEAGYVSDWHSSLFLSEMMLLQGWGSFLVGSPLTALQTLDWVAYIALGCIVLCLCRYVHVWMKWDVRFCFLSPLLAVCFAVLVMFLNRKFLGAIDYYFVTWLLVCVASLTFLRDKRKWLRFFCLILLVLSLIHLASFRRNALVLIPILLYGGVRVSSPSLHWIKGVLLALILSVVTMLGTSLLQNYLTQRKVHSVSVMMVSDLRVAAL